jgi:hypothetical protein
VQGVVGTGLKRDVPVGVEYQSPDLYLESAVGAEDAVHEAEVRLGSLREVERRDAGDWLS